MLTQNSIPVIVAICVLIYLHRRHQKQVRLEDAKDADLNLDFGLDDGTKKGTRMSMFGGEKGGIHRPGQLSMDMNLSSPYLLPPQMTQSQESMNTMARGFHNDESDPYRTVNLYTNGGDANSVRSFGKERSPLGSKNNSKRQSIITSGPMMPPPPRKNSLHDSNKSIGGKSDPFATPTAPAPIHQLPSGDEISDFHLPVQPIVPEIGTAYPDDDHHGLDMPDVQSPPPVLPKDGPLPSPPAELHSDYQVSELPAEGPIGAVHSGHDQYQLPPQELETSGLGLNLDIPTIMSPDGHYDDGLQAVNTQYAEYDSQPQIQTEYYDDLAGQNPHMDYDHDAYGMHQGEGLGVPQTATKRLSVGFRPLPPDEITESEDPEYRANRIRSFYKEYFEDTSAAPPMPGQEEYYADYDSNYLGDAAYYDAENNAFVMPYAEPVTRRAMTPPPGGRRGGPGMGGPRFRGPRGPGSVGGMSMPGRPRAGSSASAAFRRGPPKKKLPPPQALHTLPTPSKLKDDSFAIFNAADFAPPESFKGQAAGRSQSPFGERRPYQKPAMPAASPLVTAFDELSALPSPHMLRKSNTFTNLDFAPPKKFKDPESGSSDAGSIKSNKSGISAVQLGAIRAGAGRVSRLPGDTVFTSAALQDQLKPSWGLRP